MTDEVPKYTVQETTTSMYPRGEGSKKLIIFGETGETADLTTLLTFHGYQDAVNQIGPMDADNLLLAAVKDIYEEGMARSPTDINSIGTIHAVNVGDAATSADYLTAQQLTKTIYDPAIELYCGVFDTAIMTAIKGALATFKGDGLYRASLFTTDPEETDIAEIAAMTDPAVVSPATYIRSSQVGIKYDPATQAKFAAKMAYTPYWLSPALGAYRSIPASGITELDPDDRKTLTNAGIITDWVAQSPFSTSGLAEPVRAVSTAIRSKDGSDQTLDVPVDADFHARLNADQQWRQIDLRVAQLFKQNDTETGLKMLKLTLSDYLSGEAKKGYLKPKYSVPSDPGFYVNLAEADVEPYTIRVERGVRPINAIYFIEEPSEIMAPI